MSQLKHVFSKQSGCCLRCGVPEFSEAGDPTLFTCEVSEAIPPLHEVVLVDVEPVRPPSPWYWKLVCPAAAILFWILFFTFCILAGTRHWKP